jgi:hypothetical protein
VDVDVDANVEVPYHLLYKYDHNTMEKEEDETNEERGKNSRSSRRNNTATGLRLEV